MLCSMLKMMLDDVGDSAFFTAVRYQGHNRGYGSSGIATGGSYTGGGAVTTTDVAHVCETNCKSCPHGGGHHCGRGCDDCDGTCSVCEPLASVTETVTSFSSGSGAYTASVGGAPLLYSASTSRSYGYATGIAGGASWPVGLLIGDGDVPGSVVGATRWQAEYGSYFAEVPYWGSAGGTQFVVDTFGNQLIYNDPTLGFHAAAGATYGGWHGSACCDYTFDARNTDVDALGFLDGVDVMLMRPRPMLGDRKPPGDEPSQGWSFQRQDVRGFPAKPACQTRFP